MKTDPRVDAFIARQADFARPILEYLRATVHATCPECEETMKWSMPHFMYRGEMLAGMAAFRQHTTFGFWRGNLVMGKGEEKADAMGQFGRLTSIDDLPVREELVALIRKAMALTEQGVKPPRSKHEKPPFVVPQDMQAALDAHPAAAATFGGFPPSAQREYVEWIVEAKRDETRTKRLAQAIEWLAEGKRRNWKYESC